MSPIRRHGYTFCRGRGCMAKLTTGADLCQMCQASENRKASVYDTTTVPAPDWTEAACRGKEAIFYGPENEQPYDSRIRNAEAKAICHTCPLVEPCRVYARTIREGFGVWGGETDAERTEYLRREDARRALLSAALSERYGDPSKEAS